MDWDGSVPSLPIIWHWVRDGVYGETVAQSFLSVFLMYQCGYFLICLMWKSHTASLWIFFRGNCSLCSYTFSASKGGRKFSSLLSHHFVTSLAFLLFFFQKELEKQKRIKRNQQLEAIAKEHYERVLLRNKGLEPWKRLRMRSKQNLQVEYHTLNHLPRRNSTGGLSNKRPIRPWGCLGI